MGTEHCEYCAVSNSRTASGPHCRGCGLPGPADLCGPCARWEAGIRPMVEDRDIVAVFWAAVVEQARRDVSGAIHPNSSRCCARGPRACARRYLASIAEAAAEEAFDHQAILLHVAARATDGRLTAPDWDTMIP